MRVYTGAETKGTLASTKATWTAGVYEWGGFVPAFLTLRNYGAGEVPAGTREIEFGSYSSVAERVGLSVTDGPEAGTKWRVVSVDRSDSSRAIARVEPFAGVFA
ncbi:MAG: hypothetical protein M3Q39_09120 [Actinomycetota bacterium]|nr:hypothetical protein [Actinomycetota bacterium]